MSILDVEMPVPLTPVPLDLYAGRLPSDVSAWIAASEEHIDRFELGRPPVPGFVPSDFELAYRALRTVKEAGLAPGDRLLEWGCGFGVVTGLAALLGYRAFGVEIDEQLIEAGLELQDECQIDAELVWGSFVPHPAQALLDTAEEFSWLRNDGPCGYEGLGLDIEDFDVIYAYPWPGEQGVVDELFWRYAAHGALLVTYLGAGEILVQRRVGRV